jgi:hypothetical protein
MAGHSICNLLPSVHNVQIFMLALQFGGLSTIRSDGGIVEKWRVDNGRVPTLKECYSLLTQWP